MKLPVQRKAEGGEVFYHVPIKTGKYTRTLSRDQVVCYTSGDGEIAYVTLDNLSSEELWGFRRIASQYEGIQVTETKVTFQLDLVTPERESTCMVNLDLDDQGRILSIEII